MFIEPAGYAIISVCRNDGLSKSQVQRVMKAAAVAVDIKAICRRTGCATARRRQPGPWRPLTIKTDVDQVRDRMLLYDLDLAGVAVFAVSGVLKV